MADNWLSTDAMIAEVCDHAVKHYGGTTILSIRCPDKEIQKKVRKYLDSKRGGKTIDTYVGDINDTVAAQIKPGDSTPKRGKAPQEEGDMPPIQDDDDGEPTPEELDQIVEDKHNAQMADLEPDPELDGLV